MHRPSVYSYVLLLAAAVSAWVTLAWTFHRMEWGFLFDWCEVRFVERNVGFFALPIAMGVTMILQQRLNPAPPDPMQAKIMMALPFVFTFFFLFFPSGLVLYWFVNNVLSIAQQWVITKKIVKEG